MQLNLYNTHTKIEINTIKINCTDNHIFTKLCVLCIFIELQISLYNSQEKSKKIFLIKQFTTSHFTKH